MADAAPTQNEFQNAFGFSFTLSMTLNSDNTSLAKIFQKKIFRLPDLAQSTLPLCFIMYFNSESKGRSGEQLML